MAQPVTQIDTFYKKLANVWQPVIHKKHTQQHNTSNSHWQGSSSPTHWIQIRWEMEMKCVGGRNIPLEMGKKLQENVHFQKFKEAQHLAWLTKMTDCIWQYSANITKYRAKNKIWPLDITKPSKDNHVYANIREIGQYISGETSKKKQESSTIDLLANI